MHRTTISHTNIQCRFSNLLWNISTTIQFNVFILNHITTNLIKTYTQISKFYWYVFEKIRPFLRQSVEQMSFDARGVWQIVYNASIAAMPTVQ